MQAFLRNFNTFAADLAIGHVLDNPFPKIMALFDRMVVALINEPRRLKRIRHKADLFPMLTDVGGIDKIIDAHFTIHLYLRIKKLEIWLHIGKLMPFFIIGYWHFIKVEYFCAFK